MIKNLQKTDNEYVSYDEARRGPKKGLKKKGRLPAKKIKNKAGRWQTVYYRPDHKTSSKYINPATQSTHELLGQYGNSFKRMLFFDHDPKGRNSQVRGRNDGSHVQGKDMINKLNKLGDKHGMNYDNFDSKFNKIARDKKNIDGFMKEAQDIYKELYKTGNMQASKSFLENIFKASKNKVHTSGINGAEIQKVLSSHNLNINQYHIDIKKMSGDQLAKYKKNQQKASAKQKASTSYAKAAKKSAAGAAKQAAKQANDDNKENDKVSAESKKTLKTKIKSMGKKILNDSFSFVKTLL